MTRVVPSSSLFIYFLNRPVLISVQGYSRFPIQKAVIGFGIFRFIHSLNQLRSERISLNMHKLPTIDFSNKRNLKPGSTSWLTTSIEATRALEEYRCFIAEFDHVTLSSTMTYFKHCNNFLIIQLKPKYKTSP